MGIRKTFVPPSRGDDDTSVRKFRVNLPEEFLGWCMRAITTRKGSIDGMDPEGSRTTLTASIPNAMYEDLVRELQAFAVFTSLD